MCWLLAPGMAHAVDGIALEVRELTVAGIPVESASVRLDIIDEQRTRLTLGAAAATLPDPAGKLTSLLLVCDSPVIAEPRFACDAGKLTARGGPTRAVNMRVRAEYDTGSAAPYVVSKRGRCWTRRGSDTCSMLSAVA